MVHRIPPRPTVIPRPASVSFPFALRVLSASLRDPSWATLLGPDSRRRAPDYESPTISRHSRTPPLTSATDNRDNVELEASDSTFATMVCRTILRSHNGYARGVARLRTGVDLGQLTPEQVDGLAIPQDLKDQLVPYVGLTGQEAVEYLEAHPLELGEADADALDRAVIDPILNEVQASYDSSGAAIRFDLPPEAQTAIADVAVQYGSNLETRTPAFWGDVTAGRWSDAVEELRDFGDNYPTRRGREADLLQQASDRGALPSK